MKQLFYLMLICASIFVLSCNKETLGITETTENIQTPKLSENSISIDEAKMSFLKAAKETNSSSIAGITPLNLADFNPQWNQANGINYVDTSGNALTVPTTVFLPSGYRKLIFFRHNGQTTFLVATIKGTREYILRKNGHCTMNDFCGDVYYTNPDGVSTGGYRINNGVATAFLVPDTTPKPEVEGGEDEFGWRYKCVIVESSPRPTGTVAFWLFNASVYSIYPTYIDNNFGSFFVTGGNASSTNNSSMNGSAPPPINSNLCRVSFVVTDNPANGTKDMGLKNVDLSMTDPTIGSEK